MFVRLYAALWQIARDERGVTTLEYGILAAGVAVVIGIIVSEQGVFFETIDTLFSRVLESLPTVESSGG